MRYWVYVLELEGGRRYVGFSANLAKRIQAHIDGRGALVTREVKVVDVHSIKGYSTMEEALEGEKEEYRKQCSILGKERVRGANASQRFSLAGRKKEKRKGIRKQKHIPRYVIEMWKKKNKAKCIQKLK